MSPRQSGWTFKIWGCVSWYVVSVRIDTAMFQTLIFVVPGLSLRLPLWNRWETFTCKLLKLSSDFRCFEEQKTCRQTFGANFLIELGLWICKACPLIISNNFWFFCHDALYMHCTLVQFYLKVVSHKTPKTWDHWDFSAPIQVWDKATFIWTKAIWNYGWIISFAHFEYFEYLSCHSF